MKGQEHHGKRRPLDKAPPKRSVQEGLEFVRRIFQGCSISFINGVLS